MRVAMAMLTVSLLVAACKQSPSPFTVVYDLSQPATRAPQWYGALTDDSTEVVAFLSVNVFSEIQHPSGDVDESAEALANFAYYRNDTIDVKTVSINGQNLKLDSAKYSNTSYDLDSLTVPDEPYELSWVLEDYLSVTMFKQITMPTPVVITQISSGDTMSIREGGVILFEGGNNSTYSYARIGKKELAIKQNGMIDIARHSLWSLDSNRWYDLEIVHSAYKRVQHEGQEIGLEAAYTVSRRLYLVK